ncbi:hypothetical protein PENTCL1PPCAC_16353, partial [Pristionchus entomophagus]
EKKKKDEEKNIRDLLEEKMDEMLDDDADNEAPANDSALTGLSNEAVRQLHALGVDLPLGENETVKIPKAKKDKDADKSR